MHANVATIQATAGLQHLQNWPVSLGCSSQSLDAGDVAPRCLYNSELTRAASVLAHFNWAVYGFNSGHFLSTIMEHGYQFLVVLACDPFVYGRAVFWGITSCSPIHSSTASLLDHVQASGITSKLTSYLIHSHCYYSSNPTKRFWELQGKNVKQLWIIRSFLIVVAFIHPAQTIARFSQRSLMVFGMTVGLSPTLSVLVHKEDVPILPGLCPCQISPWQIKGAFI
jgi:hypothetical protein